MAGRLSATDAVGGLQLQVEGEAHPRSIALADIDASERFSHATRRVQLADGAVLEVEDGAQLSKVLAAAGRPDAMVTRWQRSWRMVAVSLVLSIAAAVGGYLYVLPAVADYLAARVPPSWAAALDEMVIAQLQRQSSLQTSTLSAAEQQRLRTRFDAVIAAQGDAPKLTVHFFKMDDLPNAFALPGGSIVFLDGLVKMAPDDDALVGVFAHEYGHVRHRHGLRTLLRTAAVSAVAAWYFGDFTSLANAAVIVSQLSYSRAFELEADDMAIELMRANKLGTQSLAELFRRMRDKGHGADHGHEHDGRGQSKDDSGKQGDTDTAPVRPKGEAATGKRGGPFSIPEFLSTHPDIEERIKRFDSAAKALP